MLVMLNDYSHEVHLNGSSSQDYSHDDEDSSENNTAHAEDQKTPEILKINNYRAKENEPTNNILHELEKLNDDDELAAGLFGQEHVPKKQPPAKVQ